METKAGYCPVCGNAVEFDPDATLQEDDQTTSCYYSFYCPTCNRLGREHYALSFLGMELNGKLYTVDDECVDIEP